MKETLDINFWFFRFSKYPILQVSDSQVSEFKNKHYLKLVFLKTLYGNPDKKRKFFDSPSIRSPSIRILRYRYFSDSRLLFFQYLIFITTVTLLNVTEF